MTKTNAANERIKRDYFRYLAEAKGATRRRSTAWRQALARFEASTPGAGLQEVPPRAGGRLQGQAGGRPSTPAPASG